MCFKKKPQPEICLQPAQKRALLFAINEYGGGNDLAGCINDQIDFILKLDTRFPGFDIRAFHDAQVTRKKFISEVTNAINVLRAGDFLLIQYSGHGTQTYDRHGDEEDGYDEAIYLMDGMVIDDDIGNTLMSIPDDATVVLLFDSCFSGTVTRAFNNPHPIRNRYFQNPNLKVGRRKRVRFSPAEMKWLVLSGCNEHQTSADAYFNDRPNGAFTYYALHTLSPGITYREWMYMIQKLLPNKDFDQCPTLEGKQSLFDYRVLI
jgi:metacaspase-1